MCSLSFFFQFSYRIPQLSLHRQNCLGLWIFVDFCFPGLCLSRFPRWFLVTSTSPRWFEGGMFLVTSMLLMRCQGETLLLTSTSQRWFLVTSTSPKFSEGGTLLTKSLCLSQRESWRSCLLQSQSPSPRKPRWGLTSTRSCSCL